jgi:hypothetical protein
MTCAIEATLPWNAKGTSSLSHLRLDPNSSRFRVDRRRSQLHKSCKLVAFYTPATRTVKTNSSALQRNVQRGSIPGDRRHFSNRMMGHSECGSHHAPFGSDERKNSMSNGRSERDHGESVRVMAKPCSELSFGLPPFLRFNIR